MSNSDQASEALWPPVAWEEHEWEERGSMWRGTRATGLRVSRYQSALPPKIASLSPPLDASQLSRVVEAQHELARVDAELGAQIHTFGPLLLRSEASSSSRIENLTASARAVFTAELGAKAAPNAQEIVANTKAMQAALDLAEEVSESTILCMHQALMERQSIHKAGQWRQEPVWIGTRGDSPVGADFVASHHERIGGLIDDLVDFSKRTDLPGLLVAAIAHAQFETIHPFTDGNGRTGRAFVQALLRHHGVTRAMAIPISAGLLTDVAAYHDALTQYRRGQVWPIVDVFVAATWRACDNLRLLAADLREIRTSWDSRVSLRRSSHAWKLLDIITVRPVIDANAAATELGVQTPNVYPALRALVEAGILKATEEYRFGTVWRSPEILAALDAFAERAGRRTFA